MNELNIELLRKICNNDDNIILTKHFIIKSKERNIALDDIISAIMTGKIIEQYPEDYPYPSCLVLGNDEKGRQLHVVMAVVDNKYAWAITAYIPDADKWMQDFSTRKENK